MIGIFAKGQLFGGKPGAAKVLLQAFEAGFIFPEMMQRRGMVGDAIGTVVGQAHGDSNEFAVRTLERRPAEHDRHVQIQVIADALRIQALDHEHLGKAASFFGDFSVDLRQFAGCGFTTDYIDVWHIASD